MIPQTLKVADHHDPSLYWGGGHYELNLSYDLLRDNQWPQVMTVIWSHTAMRGPLATRYSPGAIRATSVEVQSPPPTTMVIQHGQLTVQDQAVGCDVQATRSLFECVSILVPLGMFAGVQPTAQTRHDHPELSGLDALYYDVALHVYDQLPFQVAVIGYERACHLPAELRSDPEVRHNFLVPGNFLIQEAVLRDIEPDVSSYQQVRPGLYWMPAPARP